MRLIEAEELYKMLYSLGSSGESEEWAKGYDAAIDNAISHLDSIPVIEVEWSKKMHKELKSCPFGGLQARIKK